jgi:hypothetical protein
VRRGNAEGFPRFLRFGGAGSIEGMHAILQQQPAAAVVCGVVAGAPWTLGAKHGSRYRVLASMPGLCAVAEHAVPTLTRQRTSPGRGFGLRGPAGFHCLTPVQAVAARGSCIRPSGAFSWAPSS